MEQEEMMMLSRLFKTALYVTHEHTQVKLKNLENNEVSYPELLIISRLQYNNESALSNIDLMGKMVDWLGIKRSAVAILENDINLPSFRLLYTHYRIRNMILYGITPDDIGLQLEYVINKAFNFMDCRMLFSASFAEVQGDKKLKNEFFYGVKKFLQTFNATPIVKLIFATQNQHKRDEVQAVAGSQIIISSLKDFNFKNELPETSDSLEGNALQKAEFIYRKLHQNCFAEDTGLEIEALRNKPGVNSARYAGLGKNSNDNINLVLQEMMGVENRQARFRTIICLLMEGEPHFFEGIVNGNITLERKGTSGFGYDPIFMPDGSSKTFGQMTAHEKNTVSHRSKAIRKMMDFINSGVNYNQPV